MPDEADGTDPVWDRSVYGEIVDVLGPVRTGEALGLFEAHLRAGLALVRTVPADGERLAREAHGLVAMAGMLGFTDLSCASRRLMEHDRSEAPDREVRDLEVAAARALASLHQIPHTGPA